MTATGITRPIDNLGRICLPIELRQRYEINPKDNVEIYTITEGIVIKKHAVVCVFCQEENDLMEHNGLKVCKTCAEQIGNCISFQRQ